MLFQILDLLEIFLRQAIARSIGYIYHCGTSLDDSLHHLSQIFIVSTACILTIELHIVDIALGILRGSHCLFEDMLAVGVELIQDMLIAGADTRMDTLVLSILQGLESHIDVALYSTCQRTDNRPCHCL